MVTLSHCLTTEEAIAISERWRVVLEFYKKEKKGHAGPLTRLGHKQDLLVIVVGCAMGASPIWHPYDQTHGQDSKGKLGILEKERE